MNKTIIFVKKPANQFQIQPIIDYTKADELVFFVQTLDNRLSIKSVQQWDSVHNFKGNCYFYEFNPRNNNSVKIRELLNKQRPFNYVALTYDTGPYLWKNVKWLKQFSKIIHISDGSCDNTTITDHFLKIFTRFDRPKDILKLLLYPPIIKFIKADISFHQFYPLYKNCYSKKTGPTAPFSLTKHKKIIIQSLINNFSPEYVIMNYPELPATTIAEVLNISNYICTSKHKEILINGEFQKISDFICAEELFEVFKPKAIIGPPSDVILCAKIKYPEIPCYVILNPKPSYLSDFGTLHHKIFIKQTRKFDLIYIKDIQQLKKLFRTN